MGSFFETIGEFFYTARNTFVSVFSSIGFFDVVDILILTFLVYKAVELWRDSRARTLLKGIILIVAMYAFSGWLGMIGINWILEKVVTYAIVILVVIFQPELRHTLERVGHSSFSFFGRNKSVVDETKVNCISQVCKAVGVMSSAKIGALIVFENKTLLGDIIKTGTEIDAYVSSEMVNNIFFPKSPLHDGAIVIRNNRITAAGCILPLTANRDISADLGTRHRAALGISENSDAVTVVVSEETGIISLTYNGQITRNFNSQSLQQELCNIFVDTEKQEINPIKQYVDKIKSLLKGGNKNG